MPFNPSTLIIEQLMKSSQILGVIPAFRFLILMTKIILTYSYTGLEAFINTKHELEHVCGGNPVVFNNFRQYS